MLISLVTKAWGYFDMIDGLMGLGYKDIANNGHLPIMNALYSDLDGDVSCSFFLGDTSELSYMVMPGVDPQFYTGAITYHKVVDKGWWEIGIYSLKARWPNK